MEPCARGHAEVCYDDETGNLYGGCPVCKEKTSLMVEIADQKDEIERLREIVEESI